MTRKIYSYDVSPVSWLYLAVMTTLYCLSHDTSFVTQCLLKLYFSLVQQQASWLWMLVYTVDKLLSSTLVCVCRYISILIPFPWPWNDRCLSQSSTQSAYRHPVQRVTPVAFSIIVNQVQKKLITTISVCWMTNSGGMLTDQKHVTSSVYNVYWNRTWEW